LDKFLFHLFLSLLCLPGYLTGFNLESELFFLKGVFL
jgi:hypothetical protein